MALRAACEIGSELFAAVSADVSSFEPVRGERCGTNCTPADDGYVYCGWDQARDGCRESDFLASLPPVYACGDANRRIPTMLFNGNADPYSSPLLPGLANNSGLINFPETPVAGGYNTTFPPLHYVTRHFAAHNGCNMTVPPKLSFDNGTLGNRTICQTWTGCAANVTSCLSDAGHVWFGDYWGPAYLNAVCEFSTGGPPYDAVCLEGPGDTLYPNTYSINETAETLAFFEATSTAHDLEREQAG